MLNNTLKNNFERLNFKIESLQPSVHDQYKRLGKQLKYYDNAEHQGTFTLNISFYLFVLTIRLMLSKLNQNLFKNLLFFLYGYTFKQKSFIRTTQIVMSLKILVYQYVTLIMIIKIIK